MGKAIRSILVSQPKPDNKKSPFFGLGDKHSVKIDFRSFIHVEGVGVKEFRDQKVNFSEFTAVILTSRKAVDHFFRMCEKTRYSVPDSMKYFCVSEAVALYLQKHVVYRKRKIFHGRQRFVELMELIKKHKNEKFLLPSSDILKDVIPSQLNDANINYKRAILYRTVVSDLSDLEDVFYDCLVFYSPAGIDSLFKNFPEFKQNDTRIAVFGESTKKAAVKAGLDINIAAPAPNAPSMTGAIEAYIKEHN
ncbi:MAG: uroporphyrinogen-III synthase [Flavobacteriales bacterium]|nr:uroporphyrinogen-III synthase [Flavobacteriales bacterium]|tara:strand:- start:13545 stop:14291 length:747 start_codon:yes stop_codon:yes gene_type:complete